MSFAPGDPLSLSDVNALRAQGYVATAGFCLMLYDILMTLDVEINLVWPAPMSSVKLLFLCNRYVTPCLYIYIIYTTSGMLAQPSSSYCYEFFLTSLTLEGLSVNGIGAALMVLRVYALYGRHRGILILLSSLLALELVSSVAVMAYGVFAARSSMGYLANIHACVSEAHLSWLWIVFLFMMLFDIVIFYLVVRKTWRYARGIHAHTPLITVLLLDAVGYFAVMIATELLNIVAYTSFPSNLFLVGVNLMWCLNTTMISRIYLNLRSAARPDDWSSLTAFKDGEGEGPGTYETDETGWTMYGSE